MSPTFTYDVRVKLNGEHLDEVVRGILASINADLKVGRYKATIAHHDTPFQMRLVVDRRLSYAEVGTITHQITDAFREAYPSCGPSVTMFKRIP